MDSSALLDVCKNAGAVTTSDSDGHIAVQHFGDVGAELSAAESDSVVCPALGLVRLRATGKDRAGFLHNFCTNNVKALKPGQVCEAFFTDVKAKVLAHGMILADADCHEIWILPGDPSALLNHLNRYIITEDVVIERVDDQCGFGIIGPRAAEALTATGLEITPETNSCTFANELAVLSTTWADIPVLMASVPGSHASDLWQRLRDAGATASGNVVFEHQRIQEGYPIVGTDITSDNMAPEADRNSQAISYTKGCYLGQEPIARLDAMGHVNRRLYRGLATILPKAVAPDGAPTTTSASTAVLDQFPVLIPLAVKSVPPSKCLVAKLPGGEALELKLR